MKGNYQVLREHIARKLFKPEGCESVFEEVKGGKGGSYRFEDLKDSQSHCRTETEGQLMLGTGSSHGSKDLEGFSLHPTSDGWKGNAVSEFQQGRQQTRSDSGVLLLLFRSP